MYYGFRFYEPSRGRWDSRDSLEERGGLNLLACIDNQVISFVDSDGRAKFPDNNGEDNVHFGGLSAATSGGGRTESLPSDWVATVEDRDCKIVGKTCGRMFFVANKSLAIRTFANTPQSQAAEQEHINDAITYWSQWISTINSLGECACKDQISCKRTKIVDDSRLKLLFFEAYVMDSALRDLHQYPGGALHMHIGDTRRNNADGQKYWNAERLHERYTEWYNKQLKECNSIPCTH